MDYDLGIAVRSESVPAGLQLAAKLAKIVYLTVEYDRDSSILVVDRLLPTLEIDDCQASHGKADGVLVQQALSVWASTPDLVVH
jgi:hypothetical protein